MAVRDVAARTYREALPALAVGGAGGLFAGLVLGGMRSELRTIPGLLVLVPALLATRGNVYAALGRSSRRRSTRGSSYPSRYPTTGDVFGVAALLVAVRLVVVAGGG